MGVSMRGTSGKDRMWGLLSGALRMIRSTWSFELEAAMAVFLGLDVHRAQITFDALDVDTGEV